MTKKNNRRIFKEIYHDSLSNNNIAISAALFSIIILLTSTVAGLPLLQQKQAYAFDIGPSIPSQSAAPPQLPLLSPTQELRPSSQVQLTVGIAQL